MNLAAHAVLLSAIVTILALLLYVYMIMRVGGARSKHQIVAPSVVGHPEFERTYRVQMNTVEQMVIFLPALWLATTFFTTLPWLPAALGLVWVIARFMYMQTYIADPQKRGPGAALTGLSAIALLILAIVGIAMGWNAA
ncbi:MAG TPA: MAPEG family protein [Rhizomicrobium sp.]|nr:MAPEG family protein [Rhizomicrobium sp.]